MEKNIGELQELVLLVIGNLQSDAYGLAIKEFISESLDRKITISAVHATLQRLEEKGLVSSKYDNSSSRDRGGRPKLVYSLTTVGIKELDKIRSIRNQLWNGMEGLELTTPAS